MQRIYVEVAKLVAIEARVAAMQAMNQARESRGEAMAYGEECFFEQAGKAAEVSARIGLIPGGS